MGDPTSIICIYASSAALAVIVLLIIASRKVRRPPPAPTYHSTLYEKLPTLPPGWRRPGTCPKCGYDLRATPNRCPECGTVFVNDLDPLRDEPRP